MAKASKTDDDDDQVTSNAGNPEFNWSHIADNILFNVNIHRCFF
jgi:hypothetical protein